MRDRRIIATTKPMRKAGGMVKAISSAGPGTVLIVPSDESSLELVVRCANRSWRKATLLPATTGAAALDLVREFRPEVMVLDLELDDMCAEDVLRAVRTGADAHRTHVIAVTENVSESARARVIALGADACLTKPVECAALLAAVTLAMTVGEAA